MSMQTVYLTCMAGGILLLLSSIVFSAFDDFFDLAAFDVCSIDLGEFDLDILPVSMKSLCLAATVFGSVSMLLIDQPAAIRHVIAGVCAFIVQNITGFLKNHQSEADTIESICSRSFVVNVSIPQQGYGSVASTGQNRSVITLPAKSVDGSEIAAGTKVQIVNIAQHVAIVMKQ